MPHGVNGDVGVKFTGFNDDAGFSVSKKDTDPIKKKFDNYPGGVFTMPKVAVNNGFSDEEAGGYNA